MRLRMCAVLLAPVLALGPVACGDGGGTAGSGQAAGKSDEDRMREFARCMRANGVDMKDPVDGRVEIKASGRPGEGGPGAADGRRIDEAQKKCRHLMPNGGKPPKPKPEELARQREYSACMRENGVAGFPDPNPDGGIQLKMRKGSDMDPESPKFKKAQEACRRYAPDRGKGPA